jgi:hypothetical protein
MSCSAIGRKNLLMNFNQCLYMSVLVFWVETPFDFYEDIHIAEKQTVLKTCSDLNMVRQYV